MFQLKILITASFTKPSLLEFRSPCITALRLGVRVAEVIRTQNPTCQICFYGLYASLNEDFLLKMVADFVIGGEFESPLLQLIQALDVPTEEGTGLTSIPWSKPGLT